LPVLKLPQRLLPHQRVQFVRNLQIENLFLQRVPLGFLTELMALYHYVALPVDLLQERERPIVSAADRHF
jgi:hypothetical protein